MVAVNTKTVIVQNIFTTGEPKLAHIHFTFFRILMKLVLTWYLAAILNFKMAVLNVYYKAYLRIVYIDDKSTQFGTHILCDIQLHIKLRTNYYRHGIWSPSWIKKMARWKSLNCHNSKYIDEESTTIGTNELYDNIRPVGNIWGHEKPTPWRQWRHADSSHKGRYEQRCDMNSKRSGRDRSTSIQWICGGQAESASNKPLSDVVSKNKLALFSTPQAKQRSRSKEQVASLKTNCTLFFSRLYMACQARQCNHDSFFEHENQACPPSISDMGQRWQGSKSDQMEYLTKSSQPACIHLGIDANVLDGAGIVHMVRPGACRHLRSIPRKWFFHISPLSLKLLAE